MAISTTGYGILHSCKISSQKPLAIYKGEKSNLTVQKPGRHLLNQMITITSPVTGQINIM